MTTESNPLVEDIQFLRNAVSQRDKPARTPASIIWLWAIYVLVGYTLLDIRPLIASWFLMIGGFVGGLISMYLGARDRRLRGQRDRAEGLRHALHWASVFPAIVAIVALGVIRHLDGQTIGQFIALMIGLVYFLHGVHLDRNYLWLGLLLMAGAVGISFMPHYGWTSLGALIAVGLVVPTFVRPRKALSPASSQP